MTALGHATALCPDCQMPFELGWDFCAYCGADRRPPSKRQPVPRHVHRFFAYTQYCHVCGTARDAVGRRARKVWLLLYGTPIVIGLVLIASAFPLYFLPHFAPPVRIDSHGRPFTIPSRMQMTAVIMWVIGAGFILAAVKSVSRRPRTTWEWLNGDDSPDSPL